jgi:hypothetical protein
MAKQSALRIWTCPDCGHDAYHCPGSGCNHHENGEWCECDLIAPDTAVGLGWPYEKRLDEGYNKKSAKKGPRRG